MSHTEHNGLAGLRVLVVEDEALVGMLVQDELEKHGCHVIGPVPDVEDALRMAKDPTVVIDAAVLDVNVAGTPIFPVAEALDAADVPMVFSSGYGEGSLPEPWSDRPILAKPFDEAELAATLARLIGDRPVAS